LLPTKNGFVGIGFSTRVVNQAFCQKFAFATIAGRFIMVALIIIFFAIIVAIKADSLIGRIGIAVVRSRILLRNHWFYNSAIVIGLVSISVAASIPLARFLGQLIPNFQTPGDGGVGLGYNLGALILVYSILPFVFFVGLSLLLAKVLSIARTSDPLMASNHFKPQDHTSVGGHRG
jgi:hypothetical protein